MFNWVLFITLFICLHYRVYVGAVISGSAYLFLVASSWQAMIVHAFGGRIPLPYRSPRELMSEFRHVNIAETEHLVRCAADSARVFA